MAGPLTLAIRLEADGRAFVAGVKGAEVELERFSDTAEGAEQALKKLGEGAGASAKLAALFKATRTEAEQLEQTLHELERLRPFAKTEQELQALNRATAEAKAALHATSEEGRRAAEMQGRLQTYYRGTRTELERLNEDLRRIEETRPFARTAQDLEAVDRAATVTRTRIAELEKAGEAAGKGARLSTQQMQTLQYTASDVAASLASGASPFMVLMQQGGQALQVFPKAATAVLGIGAAAALTVGPLAIVASRIASAASETRELGAVLKGMGKDAEVSGARLRAMAIEASKIGGSRGEAYDAALALARTKGVATADMFRELLKLAPDVSAVLGVGMSEAATLLGRAMGEGAEGIKRLDDQLNFLTLAQRQQLQSMDDLGGRSKALGMALDALKDRFGGAAASMRSGWGAAIHEAKLAWDAYVDHLAETDLARIIADKVSRAGQAARKALENENAGVSIRKEMDRLDAEYSRLPEATSGVPATHEAIIRRRIELQRQLNELTGQDNKPENAGGGSFDTEEDDMKRKIEAFKAAACACDFPDCAVGEVSIADLFEEAMS